MQTQWGYYNIMKKTAKLIYYSLCILNTGRYYYIRNWKGKFSP